MAGVKVGMRYDTELVILALSLEIR